MAQSIKTCLYQTVDFVSQTACPCAFPRVLYLLTFDPRGQGLPPMEIEFAQGLINQFAFSTRTGPPILKKLEELGKGKESLECLKCHSKFECMMIEYGSDIKYMVMTISENLGRQIGADLQLPMPVPGKMVSEDRLTEKQCRILVKNFSNANTNPGSFAEYMTALK